MKTQRGLSYKEFQKKFGSNEQCLVFLSEQKWGKGYHCLQCNSQEYRQGKRKLNRRCKQCGYEESPTSNTLFHKLKFDLYKAFGMIYEIMLSKKGANSILLAERYEVSQNTAWLFRRKVQQYLKSSKNHPLTGEVHVDEFEIGTPQKNQQGRSATTQKVRVVLACEIRGNQVGNMYSQVITDFSTKSLKPIFDAHISTQASVKTDGWTGYKPLKQLYKHLTQELSNQGKNFPEIHIQIRNIKNWLRGTHSFCGAQNLQDYLNEYSYRFNRRSQRTTIITKLLHRFLWMKSPTFKQLNLVTT
jgi:hypothetical protein